MAAENGTKAEAEGEAFVAGLVYPPPAIREIADKTAVHIGKRGADGPQLEEKIRVKAAAKFNFINPSDPYHAYYQYRLKQVKAGQDITQANVQGLKAAAKEEEDFDDGRPKVARPAPLEFLLETPTVSPIDLDIIKLTALFVARSGRKFQSDLSQREKTNYQFDFLQPNHSMFGYFNRLVEQYTKVLIPDADRLARLSLQAGSKASPEERRAVGRREVLTDLDARIQWSKYEGDKQRKRDNEKEAEKLAFAEVDWQDFVVVATVEFTDADEMIDLPAPMSLTEVTNMSLREKRKTTLAIQGQNTKDLDEDAIFEEAVRVQEAAQRTNAEQDMDVEEDDQENARKQADEIKTADTNAQVKIKPSGYVPRSKRNQKIKTSPCSICGQQIPVDEIAEHVRIELLDPRWKEKQAVTDANRSASAILSTGADVSASLSRLAAQRQDIFSELSQSELDRKKQEEEEAKRRAKQREAKVWDGHVASGDMTTSRFQGNSLDDQIRALHQAKGLTEENATSTGPKIGPYGAAVAPVFTPIQPANLMSGAGTISAAPQAHNVNTNQNQQPAAFNPYAAYTPKTALNPGVTRPADDSDAQPNVKRQKLTRMNVGYHDEQAWIDSHPDGILLYIQMPATAEKPEWKCEGQILPLERVAVNSLVATLRDHIHAKTGIPIGRQQLRFSDRILTNSNTLASLNFDDNDTLTLVIKDRKK